MSKLLSEINNILKEGDETQLDEDIFSKASTLRSMFSRDSGRTSKFFKVIYKQTFSFMWDKFLIQEKSYKRAKNRKFIMYNNAFIKELLNAIGLDAKLTQKTIAAHKREIVALNKVYNGYATGKISDEELKERLTEGNIDPRGVCHRICKTAAIFSVEAYFNENDMMDITNQVKRIKSGEKLNVFKRIINGEEPISGTEKANSNSKSGAGQFMSGVMDGVSKRVGKK